MGLGNLVDSDLGLLVAGNKSVPLSSMKDHDVVLSKPVSTTEMISSSKAFSWLLLSLCMWSDYSWVSVFAASSFWNRPLCKIKDVWRETFHVSANDIEPSTCNWFMLLQIQQKFWKWTCGSCCAGCVYRVSVLAFITGIAFSCCLPAPPSPRPLCWPLIPTKWRSGCHMDCKAFLLHHKQYRSKTPHLKPDVFW